MKIATGKVVGGKVVVDGEPLEEGASVTVLARDGENGFTLSPEEEAELLLSIAEADRLYDEGLALMKKGGHGVAIRRGLLDEQVRILRGVGEA